MEMHTCNPSMLETKTGALAFQVNLHKKALQKTALTPSPKSQVWWHRFVISGTWMADAGSQVESLQTE